MKGSTNSLLVLFMLVLFTGPSVAADPDQFRPHVSQACANVELPPHVKAQDGAITLYADFDRASNKGVPLYLVNKTGSPASFEAQDGDLYIKLETKDADGRWRRAQTHAYSDCGLSYIARALPPAMHFRLLGYRPQGGRKALVRYSAYSGQSLVSNIGEGLFDPADEEAARFDRMSLRSVPGFLEVAFNSHHKPEHLSPKGLETCLKLLHAYGDVPALKRDAARQLDQWKANASLTTEEKEAAKTFERILNQPWETEPSPTRLLQYCLSALEKSPRAASAPAKSMSDQAILWIIVASIASQQFEPHHMRAFSAGREKSPASDWKRVAQLAVARIVKASPDEGCGMSALLEIGALTDAFITDESLEPLLQGQPESLAKVAATALARRGRYERLAELAMKLSPESQVVVLTSLASRGRRHDPAGPSAWEGLRFPTPGSKEELFWQQVMALQPVQASWSLSFLGPHDPSPDAYGSIVLVGLRSHWQREVQRSDAAKEDFALPDPGYPHQRSVEFLGRSMKKVDVPLFRCLLHYRGYYVEGGCIDDGRSRVPYKKQRFGVRYAALEALKRMGESVPQNVVVEKDVTDPNHVIEGTKWTR